MKLLKKLNLSQFKELKNVLDDKKQYRFNIICHDIRGVSLHDKSYTLIDDEFNGIYEPLNFVTINIFNNRVELHVMREGARTHVSNFTEREIRNLYNMTEIEKLEFAIIKAVDKWNGYYCD